MSVKSKILKIKGGGKPGMVKLPKPFAKRLIMKDVVACDYTSKRGVAVLTDSPFTRLRYQKQINALLNCADQSDSFVDIKNRDKSNTNVKSCPTNVVAGDIIKYIDSSCPAIMNTETNEELSKRIHQIMDIINTILAKGEDYRVVLEIFADSMSNGRLEDLFNIVSLSKNTDEDTADNTDDQGSDEEKDEKDKIWSGFMARHPEIPDTDFERAKYSFVQTTDDTKIGRADLKFAVVSSDTVANVPVGSLLMINNDIYLKQHNGSTIRSIINGNAIKDNLCEANYANLQAHPKKEIPSIIKGLICDIVKVYDVHNIQICENEGQIKERHYEQSVTTGDMDNNVTAIYDKVDGEDNWYMYRCSYDPSSDDSLCNLTGHCPINLGIQCTQKYAMENFKQVEEQGETCNGCHCGCAPECECDDCCAESNCGDTCKKCDDCEDIPCSPGPSNS